MGKNESVAITDIDDPYIKRLEDEKETLEQRVQDLKAEIRALNNLIYRRKSANLATRTNQAANLKNASRLFFETIILDVLNANRHGLRTRKIYEAILERGFSINYNTLRSYVMKMSDKELIKKKSAGLSEWVSTPTR